MLDVRAIANLVLDRADEQNLAVTNMALNKVVYFVHCDYLLERGEPLVGANFRRGSTVRFFGKFITNLSVGTRPQSVPVLQKSIPIQAKW